MRYQTIDHRPLKRVIQREVLNELSKQILGGKVNKDGTIILDCFDKQVVFRNQVKEVKSALRQAQCDK